MAMKYSKSIIFISFFFMLLHHVQAQQFEVKMNNRLKISSLNEIQLSEPIPLFSIMINEERIFSDEFKLIDEQWSWQEKMKFHLDSVHADLDHWSAVIYFQNTSLDTLVLENLVPLGGLEDQVYITGKGKHPLSRSHLFIPKYDPVNVILPDNAWELGYASVQVEGQGIAALARRKYWNDGASRRRFETILPPGSSVVYHIHFDSYSGDWQEGLKTVFQKKYLYDLSDFDNTLYEREDLKWIRKSYAMHLMMAWDNKFYSVDNQEFKLLEFYKRNKLWFGGDDVIGIWPTWPTLGLDQRNQWDMYRDLPGGMDQLARLSDSLNRSGTKLFIAYNPWDESTRLEGHLEGMKQLIAASGANGVVLDTKGSSSKELQEAADQVKDGVIMYSEGMAVPKDMPGIVRGGYTMPFTIHPSSTSTN
jgi:gamma-glutamyl hercynylcysteine S-oxide synthase